MSMEKNIRYELLARLNIYLILDYAQIQQEQTLGVFVLRLVCLQLELEERQLVRRIY